MSHEPYLLSRKEWNSRMSKAREALRGNGVPERITASSSSIMVSAMKEIEWLSFGIRSDLNTRIIDVQKGNIKLSPFGNARLIAETKRPVNYSRVIIKAKKLGLVS